MNLDTCLFSKTKVKICETKVSIVLYCGNDRTESPDFAALSENGLAVIACEPPYPVALIFFQKIRYRISS
jgi:hypothetical protein